MPLPWNRGVDKMSACPRGQPHVGKAQQEQLTGQGLRPFPICIPILMVGSLKHHSGIQGLPLASLESSTEAKRERDDFSNKLPKA